MVHSTSTFLWLSGRVLVLGISVRIGRAPALRFALRLCEADKLGADHTGTTASGSATVILLLAGVDRAAAQEHDDDRQILCEHGLCLLYAEMCK